MWVAADGCFKVKGLGDNDADSEFEIPFPELAPADVSETRMAYLLKAVAEPTPRERAYPEAINPYDRLPVLTQDPVGNLHRTFKRRHRSVVSNVLHVIGATKGKELSRLRRQAKRELERDG